MSLKIETYSEQLEQQAAAAEKERHRVQFEIELKRNNEEDDEPSKGGESSPRPYSTSVVVNRARAAVIMSYLKGEVVGKENPQLKHNIAAMRYNIQRVDGKVNL